MIRFSARIKKAWYGRGIMLRFTLHHITTAPEVSMGKAVTRAQAEAVLDIIEKRFALYVVPGAGPGDRPTLRDHEHEGQAPGCWSIGWEGNSPGGWALNPFAEHLDEEAYWLSLEAGVCSDAGEAREFATIPAVAEPKGIEWYPINSFTLGISPA